MLTYVSVIIIIYIIIIIRFRQCQGNYRSSVDYRDDYLVYVAMHPYVYSHITV